MAQLLHKTWADSSPRGKPPVYFACHPEDHPLCFEEITKEILRIADCAVFYYEPGAVVPDEELALDLSQMQLMVMPVTTRLLYLPSRAMDVEFSYAMEHHIPVLPLMQEPELEKEYSKKFGNLQFLDKYNTDPTAISYDEKMKQYLNAVLIGDELAAQVRAAFDVCIFLSYRKKDRKYAQELMRLLHRDEACRDIAIWYDEFLTPGEDFNKTIRDALQKSDLFLLTVTPNLVNEHNYIIEHEYPMAKGGGKPILPAEMVATDPAALRTHYADIPATIDPTDKKTLTEAVLSALGKRVCRKDDDPQHVYLIGLAYLSGLLVEKDYERAVKLITHAAEADLTEAMEKLVSIYLVGSAEARNVQMGIHWEKRLVEKAQLWWEENASEENTDRYLRYLRDLCTTYRRVGGEANSGGDLHGAKEWYRKAVELEERIAAIGPPEALLDLRDSYHELGIMEEADKNLSAAKEWYCKELAIAERLAESGTPEALRTLSISQTSLGDIALEEGDFPVAKEWYRKALALEERVAELGTPKAMQGLRYLCWSLGDVAKSEGDLFVARVWYRKALQINMQLAEDNVPGALQDLIASYERLITIEKMEKKISAVRALCQQSLEVRKRLVVVWDTSGSHEGLADAYHYLGLLNEDVGLLAESLAIWRRLAEQCPHIPEYRRKADLVEKEIRKRTRTIKNLWNKLFRGKKGTEP